VLSIMEKHTKVLCILLVIISQSFGQTVNDLRPTVTMKEYVDMQAQLQKEFTEKLIEVQVANINDNVVRANSAMEKRLDAINEFRGQLKDQAGTFITRSELWAWIVAVIGLILAVMNFSRKSQGGEVKKQ